MKFMSAAALATFVALLLPARADDHGKSEYLTNGYSLLYKLCDQEKPLDMILMVKTTPKNVADFLHQVSRAAKDDVSLLDDLHDKYPSVRLDDTGLPKFESDTRESIKGDKQHMLLFGDSGHDFAQAILVTQIEAGTYGMNLAKVLADAEPDAHRAAVVRRIGDRWQKLRNRAYALLSAT